MHATLPPSGFACHPPPGLGQKICRISVYRLPTKQKFTVRKSTAFSCGFIRYTGTSPDRNHPRG